MIIKISGELLNISLNKLPLICHIYGVHRLNCLYCLVMEILITGLPDVLLLEPFVGSKLPEFGLIFAALWACASCDEISEGLRLLRLRWVSPS